MLDLTQFPTVRAGAVDLNGCWRGKRLPGNVGPSLADGARMPLSVMNVDISGADIVDSPLVFDSGDADGVLFPTERGPVPMPWLATPSALVPMWMYTENGTPFAGDPRHALARVLDRFAERGWKVVAAMELEFYLTEIDADNIQPARRQLGGRRVRGAEVLSLAELDAFDPFFTALYTAAEDMDLDAQTAIAELGIGQFELNLNHTDAMRAADDAALFKHMVKGLALSQGMAASFMAKPFEDQPGNGAHVHFSVLDAEGNNIFDDGSAQGNQTLRHAVAGCLEGLHQTALLFAPHVVSYDRLVPGTHAPTGIGWGYENRTAAIRIPGGSPKARRIEHRVSGGDVCPYLLMAGALGAALAGIEDAEEPAAPLVGNAYEAKLPQIPATYDDALEAFEKSALARRIFPDQLINNFLMTKRQERDLVLGMSLDERLRFFLERV